MTIPGASPRILNTSAELQEFLLAQPTGALSIVPHLRLAHQVWRRQRLAARAVGQSAWEPVAMTTLSGWWQELWRQLWLPVRPASTLQRLVLWLRAVEATPPEEGVTADLSWAAALDEAYDLCQRYQMPPPDDPAAASSLILWRQAVTQKFAALLTEYGLIPPAAMSQFLLEALRHGKLRLPAQLVLVGLETPAAVEEQWLSAVARDLPVQRVRLAGRQDSEITLKAVALPDRRQEMEWVAAQVLDLAHEKNLPLHRLAITAPNLETYLSDLHRIWQELLGPAATEAGGLYNFSLGPTLAETPLFQAALLPLNFTLQGEQRQDLISWLLSPYYGIFQRYQKTFLHWDLAWRQAGVAYGWQALKKALPKVGPPETGEAGVALIDQARALLSGDAAPAALWQSRLLELWNLLGFPSGPAPEEAGAWQALLDLLAELAAAGGERLWSAATLVEWLNWGAGRLDLAGEGSSEAGIQVLGLLEMRGLDFEAVFCLGMNMGVFPPPPRNLPLLTSKEKALVLGGDYQTQQEFARTSYTYLLASAPELILTRPLVDEEEDRLASPIIPPDIWEPDPVKFAALSQFHPAWWRSPAVRAAFLPTVPRPNDQTEFITIPLPEVISLSALETALACPCRFYLNVLLGLEELPDIAPGLSPLERGSVMHSVLQTFTGRFLQVLEDTGVWDDGLAREHLQAVAAEYMSRGQENPHWEAEMARWLEGEEALLRQWLGLEKQRFLEGWRWLAMENTFTRLQLPGWPTRVRGRLDRVDTHQTQGVMLWDYKTGSVPKLKDIEEDRSQFQLSGYLLAVAQGLTAVPPHPEARAGIIGLKSSREDHLKFEEFKLSADGWRELLDAKLTDVARLGARVGEGDFHPDPSLPPPARNNSCQYCPFALLCGYSPETEGEEAQ